MFALAENRPTAVPDHKNIRSVVLKIAGEKQRLSKNKNKEAEEKLLNAKFKFPITKNPSEIEIMLAAEREPAKCDHVSVVAATELLEERTCEIEKLLAIINENSKHTAILNQSLRDLSISKNQIDEQLTKMQNEMAIVKANHKKSNEKLHKLMNKLSRADKDLKNSAKRQKRRDAKILELENDNQELQKMADASKDLVAELESVKRAKRLEQQSKSHFKVKAQKLLAEIETNEENASLSTVIVEKDQQIRDLENKNMELEERIEDFINNKVKLFYKNTYKKEIREVYQDIMTLVGGANNVEKIVREVLEKIAGLEVDRLPKATFAKYMYWEARGLAQIQLAQELLSSNEQEKVDENLTLHSDGTTKYGYFYGTFDVTTAAGESRILGLREMHEGSASTQLETLKEVLADIAAMGNAKSDNSNNSVDKIVASIKNVMSDRCIVQKKFNEILAKYRNEILPNVVGGWSQLNESQQNKISNMNDFFCGLHFIVGMADQAEAALKVFDSLLYKNPQAVGSLRPKRGIGKGESGTLRLIRTVCKAVQAKGCEKSGRAVQFLTFLQGEKGLDDVPLAPFRGNRFNITFYNGSGVYFLFPHLLEFFESVQSENRLLGAVFDDLQVKSFVAGCRALGLISKIITEPLWKILEDKSVHILDMSQNYQQLLSCFESCAENALSFMKGEVVVFDGVSTVKDRFFEKLVEPSDNYDVLTLQALELIFFALVVKTKRMLADHLVKGKYSGSASEALVSETKSVAKTNVNPERDFGMLDRLMVEKPRATSLVLEGIIMFRKNQTGVWRDKLPESQKQLVMDLAQKSKVEQKKTFLARQLEIKKCRMAKRAAKAADEEQKALKLRVKKGLMEQIGKFGGVWATENEIKTKLETCKTENDKIKALHLQIQFRKVVLGAVHSDKTVFQLSSAGKKFDSKKLFLNLCSILECSKAEREGAEQEEEELEFPTCIEKAALQHQKKLYKQQAAREAEEEGSNKRKQQKQPLRGGKKPRVQGNVQEERYLTEEAVPIVQVAEDLIGKRVRHLCSTGEDEGEDDDAECLAEWYDGTVLEMKGTGRNPYFTIKYDGFAGTAWTFKLMKHFELGVLELLPVKAKDFIGAHISHRLDVGDCEEWFSGKVLGVVPDSDTNNPQFSVEYFYGDEESTDSDSNEDDYFSTNNANTNIEIYPLIEDYLNGDIRFL